MKIITAQQVEQTLSMSACIELMAGTQMAISQGELAVPLRSSVPITDTAQMLLMPGTHPGLKTAGVKLLSLFPDNGSLGKPVIQGSVVLFDTTDGSPLAVVDSASLTAIRTAAASAMATRALARESASRLAILGYGVQAASHLQAMRCVRDIRHVLVWGPDRQRCEAFVRAQQTADFTIATAPSPRLAIADADLICAVTGATTPIIHGEDLPEGVHINLVGAHSPDAREADGPALQKARVFTEVTAFALAESGDLLQAIASGHLRREDIAGEIGDVLLHRISGRTHSDQITLYKSLGNIAQDLAAARYVFDQLN